MNEREKLWTKSNWRVVSERPHIVKTVDGSAIADAWGFDVTDDQMKANAQLISAAPDLVDSGEQLIAELEALISAVPVLANSKAYIDMKKAIDKAYGDESQ